MVPLNELYLGKECKTGFLSCFNYNEEMCGYVGVSWVFVCVLYSLVNKSKRTSHRIYPEFAEKQPQDSSLLV